MKPEIPSWSTEDALNWVRRNAIPLALILGAAAAYALSKAELSTGMKVGLITAAAVALLGYGPAGRVVDWLYSPDHEVLIEYDGTNPDDGLAIYKLAPSTLEGIDVVEGSLGRETTGLGEAFVCREFDQEAGTARGAWWASVTDWELRHRRTAIKEMRNELEPRAQRYHELRIRLSGIVSNALESMTQSIIESVERSTLPDGDVIQRHVDSALEGVDETLEQEAETLNGEKDRPEPGGGGPGNGQGQDEEAVQNAG